MPAPDGLRAVQRAWADHLRDPASPPPAGVPAARLALYRRLCLGATQGVLEPAFPRLRLALGPSRWGALVAAFVAGHRCRTPLFPRVGGELLAFLCAGDAGGLPPWAVELAHFEWTLQELALAEDDAHDDSGTGTASIAPRADPTAARLRLSPHVRVCGYRWPVHALAVPDPDAAVPDAPTLLALYRRPDHALQAMELTAFAYRLLRAIGADPAPAAAHLRALAEESGEPADAVAERGRALLARLRHAGMLRPVRPDGGRARRPDVPSGR